MCEFAYMKFYPGDFLADTLDLNRADLGSYMLLLMAMWRQDGELPFEPKSLARICRVRRDWPKTWERLQRFFIVSDDGKTITQKRLSAELDAARARSARATKGASQSQQNVHSKSRKPLNNNDPTSQRARATPEPVPVQNERPHSDARMRAHEKANSKPSFATVALDALDRIQARLNAAEDDPGTGSADLAIAALLGPSETGGDRWLPALTRRYASG